MVIFDIVEALMPFVEAMIFFLLFEAFLDRKQGWSVWRYVFAMFVLAGMITGSNFLFLFTLKNSVVIVLLAILVANLCYEGPLWAKVSVPIIAVLISMASELVVVNLIATVFTCSVTEVVSISLYRFMGILLSKSTALAVCNGIRVKRGVRKNHLHGEYWMLYLALFGIVGMAIFLIFRMGYELNSTYLNTFATICAIGLLFCTFLVLFLYEKQAEQGAQLRLREQYEHHLKAQVKHLDEILLKQEELRRIKHDMNNQLAVIQGYLQERDIEGGETYVKSLMQRMQTLTMMVKTGNSALDAILNTKKSMAESKGIDFDIDVQISRKIPLESVDVCVIFGNALDNAIEACERMTQGEKYIHLVLVQRPGKLFCHLTNTTDPNLTKMQSTTSKSDKENHGFGLINLRESLGKYDSEPVIEVKEGIFSLKFIVYEGV